MNEFKIYEYDSLEDYAQQLPVLAFNWTVIRICFELWRDDIDSARNVRLKLHKIVGVGENYINEMCAGRVRTTNKLFHAENDVMLLKHLQGKKSIMEKSNPFLKKYVALNIACNSLVAEKKKITSICKKKNIPSDKIVYSEWAEFKLLDEWIQQHCKGNPVEQLEKLKKQIIDTIKYCGEKNDDDQGNRGLTIYGKLKRFLEGRNTEKVILSENQEKIARLLSTIYEIPYSTIQKLDDDSLEELYVYVKMFYNKIEAEVNIRQVKEVERKFYEKVVGTYLKNN
ncbi:MAG: hypothetical protein IKU39_02500 [Lachnospiraceae bacterium]|nr:hypothetical protein [Lachnospiraceae bacterium]